MACNIYIYGDFELHIGNLQVKNLETDAEIVLLYHKRRLVRKPGKSRLVK